METVFGTEAGDVRRRLVIAGHEVDSIGLREHGSRHFVEPPAPIHQVAGHDVHVGLHRHRLLEGVQVVVNIGKHHQTGHSFIIVIALRVVRVSPFHARRPSSAEHQQLV